MNKHSSAVELSSEVDQVFPVTPVDDISQPTDELVIGVVGAIGAGVSKTTEEIKRILREDYNYEVEIIKARRIHKNHSQNITIAARAQDERNISGHRS